ncbi:MAG TPA: Gfo/Idh/MocA family oxidoreductase [Anaeromyxobacter sp.]|nr:Gfo/Idh/MocA family oxidoreductase [Anaeromyxobacter sp.]
MVHERRLRVGVVGTSWWAELEHLPGLASRADVELSGLCGRDPTRLSAVAARHGIPETYTDWRELLSHGRLDAVVISTPNHLHREQALAAVEAGLHVICEKPLALTLAQAREMADRAARAGVRTLVFFTHRTIAASEHARRLVRQGLLGRPLQVCASYFTNSHLRPGKKPGWRMQRALAGTGVLGDIGSHLVDLLRSWLGDFTRVSAQWLTATRERDGVATDADEQVSFLAELACGAQAVVCASKLAAGRGNLQRVEILGTEGSLVWEAEPGLDATWEGRLWLGRPASTRLEPVPLPPELCQGLDRSDPQLNRNEAYRRLTDPFFAAVRDGGPVTPDFTDGAAVQAVLDAVAESAERHTWVNVPGCGGAGHVC